MPGIVEQFVFIVHPAYYKAHQNKDAASRKPVSLVYNSITIPKENIAANDL